jgi:hypothetical protein
MHLPLHVYLLMGISPHVTCLQFGLSIFIAACVKQPLMLLTKSCFVPALGSTMADATLGACVGVTMVWVWLEWFIVLSWGRGGWLWKGLSVCAWV